VKIIHIAPTPFFANRGCHIRIRNEIIGLTHQKMQVILCTYGLGNDVQGIDVRRIITIPGYKQTTAGFSPYKFIADILLFFLVLETTWKEKPDVLHGHLHEGALLGWAVKILLFWRKMPLFMDMQGSLCGELSTYGTFKSFPFIHRGFFLLEKIICSLPNYILCSSQNSLDFLIDKCGVPKSKVSVLVDVVPDRFFQKHDTNDFVKKHDIPDDKCIVIYTGSLLPGKGIDYLLEAIKDIIPLRKDIFFILVGYPKEHVEQYIQKYGFEDRCLVVGEVPYEELASWLAIGQLAVDPKGETSGEASGKILHYMASGLPIVCFDTTNNRLCLDKNAFFAQLTPTSELSHMIIKGIEEKKYAAIYAQEGKKKVKREYSLTQVAEKLISHYKKQNLPRQDNYDK